MPDSYIFDHGFHPPLALDANTSLVHLPMRSGYKGRRYRAGGVQDEMDIESVIDLNVLMEGEWTSGTA